MIIPSFVVVSKVRDWMLHAQKHGNHGRNRKLSRFPSVFSVVCTHSCSRSSPSSPTTACWPQSPTNWGKTSRRVMLSRCVNASFCVVFMDWLWPSHGFISSSSQGSVAIAGAVVRWLRDNMGIIKSSAEIGTLFIMRKLLILTNKHPLLSSLSIPRDAGSNSWNVLRLLLCPGLLWTLRPLLGAKCKRVKQLLKRFFRADGCENSPGTGCKQTCDLSYRIICGLTQFTNKSHLAFAALEAVCFQTREVRNPSPSPLRAGPNISISISTYIYIYTCIIFFYFFYFFFHSTADWIWCPPRLHFRSIHFPACCQFASGHVLILSHIFCGRHVFMATSVLSQPFVYFTSSRAVVCCLAHVTQILDAMNQDSRVPLTQLQVDGGMTSNRLLMQLQADILCTTVGTHVHTRSARRCFYHPIMQSSGVLSPSVTIWPTWTRSDTEHKLRQNRYFLTYVSARSEERGQEWNTDCVKVSTQVRSDFQGVCVIFHPDLCFMVMS